MGNVFLLSTCNIKATICLFFLSTTTFMIANSGRILDEVDPKQPQLNNNLPLPAAANSNPSVTTTELSPATSLPSGQTALDSNADPPIPEAQVRAPITPAVVGAGNGVAKEPSLSFFVHDILGGSHPSARVVAGIEANTDVTGLPFSKLNNHVFPITGGMPLVNLKLNGIITNNNLPLLVGLNGGTILHRGTSNVATGGNNQPFMSAGNLPAGLTLQKLIYGSVTVIDDQVI